MGFLWAETNLGPWPHSSLTRITEPRQCPEIIWPLPSVTFEADLQPKVVLTVEMSWKRSENHGARRRVGRAVVGLCAGCRGLKLYSRVRYCRLCTSPYLGSVWL